MCVDGATLHVSMRRLSLENRRIEGLTPVGSRTDNITNSNHDIWGMGDHAVKGVVGRGRDQRTYSYKYESTRAAAHTTFMRLTDEWKRANRYNGAYRYEQNNAYTNHPLG